MSNSSKNKVYLKVYVGEKAIVVAVCDKEVLGKKYQEGKFVLDVASKFFGGNIVDIPYALTEIRKATMANLVGPHIVDAAIEAKIIHPDAVLRVQDVPHAQRMTV